MSALATVVGSLGELTESELRQLYLMVGVRLGIPDVPIGQRPIGGTTGGSGKFRPSSKKSLKRTAPRQAKPARKSQWANHPLYQEYSRLKRVVENQSKEGKTSFNKVDTPERRAYQLAFVHWMEAKSSFRDRSGHKAKNDDEESSEDEEVPAKPASRQKDANSSSSAGENSPAPPARPAESAGKSSKTASPPIGKGKGKAGS